MALNELNLTTKKDLVATDMVATLIRSLQTAGFYNKYVGGRETTSIQFQIIGNGGARLLIDLGPPVEGS